MTRSPKRKEIDEYLVDSAITCSKPLPLQVEQKKYAQLGDQISVVQTGDMDGTCQESLRPLFTTQASEMCMDQEEPCTYEEKPMDQTVTCTKSTLQNESICKQKIPVGIESKSHKAMDGEVCEHQSSKLEAGCTSFCSDGDILEFDCLMDCTDSQLVHVDDRSSDDKPPSESRKHEAR